LANERLDSGCQASGATTSHLITNDSTQVLRTAPLRIDWNLCGRSVPLWCLCVVLERPTPFSSSGNLLPLSPTPDQEKVEHSASLAQLVTGNVSAEQLDAQPLHELEQLGRVLRVDVGALDEQDVLKQFQTVRLHALVQRDALHAETVVQVQVNEPGPAPVPPRVFQGVEDAALAEDRMAAEGAAQLLVLVAVRHPLRPRRLHEREHGRLHDLFFLFFFIYWASFLGCPPRT